MNMIEKKFIQTIFDMQYDCAAESISALQRNRKRIYIFGAGAAGKLVNQNLHHFGLSAYRFVDNSSKKIGSLVDGVPVIGFQELQSAQEPKMVLIGTVAYHNEVVDQCINNGIPEHEICYADLLHYSGNGVVRNYFSQNIDAIMEIFSHCADETSREIFIANLLYQLNRDRRHYRSELSPLSTQYYDPEIMCFNDDEVYFDCGAKDGDTAIQFHELRGGHYKKLVTFEPDTANFVLLKDNTRSMQNILNINAGVGESEEVLAFDGQKGGHSSFSEDGALCAKILPLDNFIDEKPTFIKMDIEGFELSALTGAKEILQKYKPKLAICVYHKPCDLVELPKYILSQRNDYKLIFRLYRDFGHDLVCYCI